MAALRHWDRISSYDEPGAWVRRVVVNRAVFRFRKKTAEVKAVVRLRGRPVVPEIPAESAAVWDAVRRLPRRQPQVVALRYLDGRPIADIARILGCSENTVKTHLQRAKQTLARRLGEETLG